MNHEQITEARKDFELGIIFHFKEMFPGEKSMGCIMMDDDGKYLQPFMQAAWRGYLMGHGHTQAMLERFNKDRFISNAMTHELCAAMEMPDPDSQWARDVFHHALRIAGAFPK